MEKEQIRIQDDLYEYVNHDWIEKAVIPDDKPLTGGFADLGVGVEEKLINDFKEMCKSQVYENEYLEKASKIFKTASDTKRRKKEGFKPALKLLKKIDSLTNVSSLNRKFVDFIYDDLPLPINLGVMEDMKDSNIHALYLQGPSTILPDVTYYKDEMKAQGDQILGLWKMVAGQVLSFTKLAPEMQPVYIEDAVKFDAIIAGLVKSREEWSEYTKMYNPMKTTRVGTLLRPLKYKKALENIFGEVPEYTIVTDVRFLKGFNTLFNEENFVLYKHWAYVNAAISATAFLSDELREIGSQYSRALSGVKAIASTDKFALQMASAFFSEPIGIYYGKKYFGEAAKKDITEMVLEIIETYKRRVKENNFLEESTKEKAILKLSTMKVKMAYPDDVIDELVKKMDFEDGLSLFEIMSTLVRIKIEDNFKHLNKPTNKNEWAMPGHMVNACYNPTSNDITFPAAILQAPFYSYSQTRSQNLGGIGAVIGHEISHAFDNNGANCDENGNLNNWWTKEDQKKFKAKTKDMIKQFDGIMLPQGRVNGTLVVSENIADNGGMAVTLDIMSHMKEKNYEEYFTNWAKVWCMKAKPEYLQLLLNVDVHSPAYLRANMQPRNFPEWYETFKVKKTDKMYIAPNKRIVIW